MIQLHVLTGASAGQRRELNTFPITVGRAADCSVTISDAGVFERHFEIQFSSAGFTLQASSHAVVTVNGARVESASLRNGDIIHAGYPKIQFWLGALEQRALKLREALTWALIAAVAGAQVYSFVRLLSITR